MIKSWLIVSIGDLITQSDITRWYSGWYESLRWLFHHFSVFRESKYTEICQIDHEIKIKILHTLALMITSWQSKPTKQYPGAKSLPSHDSISYTDTSRPYPRWLSMFTWLLYHFIMFYWSEYEYGIMSKSIVMMKIKILYS